MFGIYSPANSFAARAPATFEHFERSIIGEGSNAYYGAKALTNITNAVIGGIQAATGAQSVILGVKGGLAGGAVTTTGIGAVIGVPTMAVSAVAVAAGAVMTGHGVSMVKTSTENFQNNISKINSNSGSDSKSVPKNFYNSIKEAPKYPDGFQSVQNGTKKYAVNNQELLDRLRQIESGKWQKVYKDGYVNGEKVSIHYFESPSGKVFDVETHYGKWSNASSGR